MLNTLCHALLGLDCYWENELSLAMVAVPSSSGTLSALYVILHNASEIPIASRLDADGVGWGRK